MEKDIGKIPKNPTTDILVRVDDFGGKTGITIREFVSSEKYTGFTKAGTRIPADHFLKFREMINSIDVSELTPSEGAKEKHKKTESPEKKPKAKVEKPSEDFPDY